VVEGDHPAAVDLSEEAGVDPVLGLAAALEPVAGGEHRRVGRDEVDAQVPEMELAAAGRVAAIVANIMVERAMPVLLDLAFGDE
jgi:hypothetical protein